MNKRVIFNPDGPARAANGGVDIRNVRCPCGGVCFDITRGIAHFSGVREYECDKCHTKYAKRISDPLKGGG